MPEAPLFPALDRGAVVTVGTFDGVHLGHRDIIRVLCERADAAGLLPVLVTFRPHPLQIVNPPAAPMLLTPGEEQLEALADSGPLHAVVLPFTPAVARLSADAFVLDVLVRRYRLRELIIGFDHGMGRGRQGDAATLARLGAANGFAVHVVGATHDASGTPISSSAVRTAVAHGDLDRARRALGRPYAFRGVVGAGAGRGRDLGYPTLNVQLADARKLLPPDGVYAVRATSARGTFGGMMNLGGRPTFGDERRTLEVHLFEASGEWYGESVSVQFMRRLRDTVRFESVEALVAQLARDAGNARAALTQD